MLLIFRRIYQAGQGLQRVISDPEHFFSCHLFNSFICSSKGTLAADETRSTIVMLLRESAAMCICELCGVSGKSKPKISRHMALLSEAERVIDRREGKWVHYCLSPHVPAQAVAIIDTAWKCEH